MRTVELNELPEEVEYANKTYTFFTHLEDVILRAVLGGEDILKVVVTKRRRNSFYNYIPQYRRFIKNYYYIHNPKKELLNYYHETTRPKKYQSVPKPSRISKH